MAEDASTGCVGRFTFLIPMGVTEKGRAQAFDRVDITVHRAGTGVGPAEAWRARVAEIAALPIPLEAERPLVREVRLDPELPGVFFYGNELAVELLTLEAQSIARDWILRWRTKSAAGQERDMESAIRRVAGAFKLSEPGAHASGFCVGPGAIAAQPQMMEQASVRYVDAARGIALSLATRSVRRIDDGGVVGGIAGIVEKAGRMGFGVRVLRARARPLAGLSGGEEQVVSVDERGDVSLHFLWRFAGRPTSIQEPRVEIEMTAPAAIERDALAAWDRLLLSLRRQTAVR